VLQAETLSRWPARRALRAVLLASALLNAPGAVAATAFSCGGAAMMGGAQLVCSHVDPKAPAQFCTFSWALMSTAAGATVVSGSFLLTPGVANLSVYQGSGFAYALSNRIVLCQQRKSGR
jgi:hypothetical protein